MTVMTSKLFADTVIVVMKVSDGYDSADGQVIRGTANGSFITDLDSFAETVIRSGLIHKTLLEYVIWIYLRIDYRNASILLAAPFLTVESGLYWQDVAGGVVSGTMFGIVLLKCFPTCFRQRSREPEQGAFV